MGFSDRNYYVFLIRTGAPTDQPYSWNSWRQVALELDPFVESKRGKASIVSTQTQNKNDAVSFGRMTWNDVSHQKWTHGSPSSAGGSSSWYFARTEVWLPSRSKCVTDDAAPDFYLSLWRDGFVFAFHVDTYADRVPEIDAAIRAIGKIVDASMMAYKQRQWSERHSLTPIPYRGSLQDIFSLQSTPPSTDGWQLL